MPRITYIEDMNKWRETFQFSHPVTVRFSETDMFGHLNNTVPFTYFELARIEYFKDLGFMKNWVDPTFESIPVVADLQCDYIKQVFYDDHLQIFVKAVSIGNSSVDLHYMAVKNEEEIVFTGRGTIVQISRHTGKSIPWNEDMKKLFKQTSGLTV
ncbi:acyl-CoA thioesterase [Bacillus testis]|uniref:acyl-CoA thioesterase n=1 Tax=Bacillus testis TaxID=1622072 RepID=UPI00067EB127|nr:thioesterase family protein [Bacillus testis]